MADSDVGKLFVGGISRDTTDAILRDHFTKYGDVSSAIIAKDRLTGLPRGFGFITFSDPSYVDNALRDHHFIAGRPVEVKKALPRYGHQSNAQQQQQQQQPIQPKQHQQPIQPQQHQQPSQGYLHTSRGSVRSYSNGKYCAIYHDQNLKTKKIFVGGLSADLTEVEFKKYFEQFGRITDVVVMYDPVTNKPRGFGFITFDSEEVVEKLLKESEKSPHELCGKLVEVKKAVPREQTRNSHNGHNSRFGGGRFSPAATGGYFDDYGWPRGTTSYVSYAGPYPYYGGVYGGAYPIGGGYSVVGYGIPGVPPTPRNSFGVMGVRPLPGHYGTGFYPTGNGGVTLVGMYNGYNGVVNTGVSDVSDNTEVPTKDSKKNSKNS